MRSGSGGETDSGYQGCGFSSVAQLLNACQVKADGTTGDYRQHNLVQYMYV